MGYKCFGLHVLGLGTRLRMPCKALLEVQEFQLCDVRHLSVAKLRD